MKKILNILLAGISLMACTPDYDNILPLVETVDVSSPEDGVILMKGRVTDARGLEVDAAGFCASFDSIPTMEQAQVIGSGSLNNFNGYLYYQEEGQTIFVRTFAVNEYGYSYGNIIPFTTPAYSPPTVPCSQPKNTLKTNGAQYNLLYIYSGEPYQVFGDFALKAEPQSSGPSIFIELNRQPRNGIYTTVHGPEMRDKGDDVARVLVKWSNYVEVNQGQKLYITEQSNGSFLFELCDVQYTLNGFDLKVSAAIEN